MGSDYEFIQYLDANNLYGWAMSQKLPTGDFKWMTAKQLDKWFEHPCILEVDLEYLQELHDLHDDYPLAPERVTVDKVEKLIPNLNNKEKIRHPPRGSETVLGFRTQTSQSSPRYKIS